jgi:hypothetical protein
VVLGIILALVFASVVGYVGRHFPTHAARMRQFEDGYKKGTRSIVEEFVQVPWKCEHVHRGGAIFAELVGGRNGEKRITLPNLNIPNGSFVDFMWGKDRDPHPDSPYLGGYERRLQMTIRYTRAKADDG